jgi:F-type H+-transporting ATPase subunit a
MSNLFRIFDPSTREMLSLNWIVLLFPVLVLCPNMSVRKRRLTYLKNTVIQFLEKDFGLSIGGKRSPNLLPILISLFYLILVVNVRGLIPYVYTGSSRLSFTLSLSLLLWLSIQVGFVLRALDHLIAHLVPLGTPGVLIPFIVFIELIRSVIRPLTLAVRLAANIVAGHLLICLVNSVSFCSPVLVLAIRAGVLLIILEFSVVFIQAYVFRTLTSLYYAEFNDTLLF